MIYASSVKQIMDRVLDLLIEATKAGKLTWERFGYEDYQTIFDGHKVEVTFLYPHINEGIASGADIAKISFGGTSQHYFNGTDGMLKITYLLELCDLERREWNTRVAEKLLIAEADLKKYLEFVEPDGAEN